MTLPFAHIIGGSTNISERQVDAVLTLLDEGATIPFIARYRKEKTGSLDEVQIAAIQAQYGKLQELAKRKETIYARLDELGNEDKALRARIADCWDATELEDIYLPYKPHRKTRADIAIEKGLLPLAEEILKQRPMKLPDEESLQGARDIIAQRIAEDEKSRNAIRREFSYTAMLSCKAVKTKCDSPEAQNYKDYFDFKCPLKHIKSHQLLAIRRAESEGFLSEDQNILNYPEISYHFDSETMQALIESNVKLLKRIQTAPSGFTISSQKFGGSTSTPAPKNKNKRDWKKKSAGFSKGGFINAQKKFG